jgi:hypothetical protein
MLAPKSLKEDLERIRHKHGLITEQESSGKEVYQKIDIGQSVEDTIEKDIKNEKDKQQTYEISGYYLVLHGTEKSQLELKEDVKTAFQQTTDEFISQISTLVKFEPLNLYPDSVEWSGKLVEFGIEFVYKMPELDGIYIKKNIIKPDKDFSNIVDKLKELYKSFRARWGVILQNRGTTNNNEI